jgi:hypothetical protein
MTILETVTFDIETTGFAVKDHPCSVKNTNR